MPSLKDIAKYIGDSAVINAPRRTTNINRRPKPGNLKRQLEKYNTPTKMLGNTKENPTATSRTNYGIEFTLDYAPPGAEYGAFVENGTSRQPAQHFAQRAIDDPYVSIMIDEYVGIYVNENVVSQIQKQLDDMEID